MLLQAVTLEIVKRQHLLPIVLQQPLPLLHLVDPIHIVDGEAGAARIEDAAAKGDHRPLVPHQVQYRGVDIRLRDHGLGLTPLQLPTGVEEDNRYAEGTRRGLVLPQHPRHGVVCHENEERALVPGLTAGGLEEAPQR